MDLFTRGLTEALGYSNLDLQSGALILIIVFCVVCTAGNYRIGLIFFPFLSLIAFICFKLWGLDGGIFLVCFFLGIVFMAIGIYLGRQKGGEALIS